MTEADIREVYYHIDGGSTSCRVFPMIWKTYDISVLYVTGEATTQTLRFAARNAAMSPLEIRAEATGSDAAPRSENAAISASEMRTERPRRCTGSAPELMSRRTVRVDVLKISAVSSIVRSLVTGRPRCAGDMRGPF